MSGTAVVYTCKNDGCKNLKRNNFNLDLFQKNAVIIFLICCRLAFLAEYIQGKIDQLPPKNIDHQHVTAWDTIKDLTRRKSKPLIRVRGGSASERKKNWLDHFKKLLGATPTISDDQELPKVQIAGTLNISTKPFTMEELNAVTSTLKDQKLPGLDNIPGLIWKDSTFHDLLLHICNYTLLHLNPPSAWRKTGIIPPTKKGDLTLPSNYRGISLSAIASKIYNKLLLRHIVPEVDPLLRKNQNGFRRGRSTISQILSQIQPRRS